MNRLLQNERYMDDVFASIFTNFRRKTEQKQHLCIWDDTVLNLENTYDTVQTERSEICDKVFEDAHVSSTEKIPKSNEIVQQRIREMIIPENHADGRRPPKSLSMRDDLNLEIGEHKNDEAGEEREIFLRKTITNEILNTEAEAFSKEISQEISFGMSKEKEFDEWCKKRHEESIYKSKLKGQPTSHCKNIREESLSTSSLGLSSTNHKFSCEYQPKAKGTERGNRSTKKRGRTRSKSPIPDTRQKQLSVDSRNTQKYSKSTSQLEICRTLIKTQVCIKITDEKNDKSQEFTVDIADILRIKRNFPKFGDILPAVDDGNNVAQYCKEVVNIILRFVLFRRYSLGAIPSATIGVEVLAAIKAWEINEFQPIFFKDFTQNTLPSSNISLVFSQASYYGLDEVCDACKKIAGDNISLNSPTYKRKQKICFISIFTYIEPLDFSIPFHPIEQDFSLSFERHICNTLRFTAISGSFTIIGIYIQLNDDHLGKCNNLNMLNIDYSTKNISEDREVGYGRYEKPQRPINVIYFKKHLVVKPKQTVEITVETDIKPYLCSVFQENVLLKRVEGGKFSLSLVSDFKLPKSGKNLCIIGKLLYYMHEPPDGKKK